MFWGGGISKYLSKPYFTSIVGPVSARMQICDTNHTAGSDQSTDSLSVDSSVAQNMMVQHTFSKIHRTDDTEGIP